MWWRVPLIIVIALVGSYATLLCVAGWLFMGWMGSQVQTWEPFVWPLGLATSVLVPVAAGRWLLGRPGKRYWLTATGAAVTALIVVAVVFGAG
jgi:hypothetical protein